MTIDELKAHETAYRPHPSVAEKLATKTLVMIVGPAGIGKSTIMNEIVAQSDDFARVTDFTTRPPRPNDEPGIYRYLSVNDAATLVEHGQAVQYAVHPTTSAVYGTEAEDYPAPFNVLDTLSGVVESLRQLPFRHTVTISLTAAPHTWHDWFLSRYPEPSDERTKRLNEARQSITWSLAQTTQHHWLLNEAGEQANVAAEAIKIARGESNGLPGLQDDASHLLAIIDELLSTGESA